jgi:hypothetical protein
VDETDGVRWYALEELPHRTENAVTLTLIVPLLFILILLGDMMGITREQAEGKYVYYAEQRVEGFYGTGCIRGVLGGAVCAGLEPRIEAARGGPVAVLFPDAWSGYWTVQKHVVRHEVEHLLRALGQAPGNTYDEEDVGRVTCEYVWTVGFCS